jgi:hypothetical protein
MDLLFMVIAVAGVVLGISFGALVCLNKAVDRAER